jgi:helix-turn-helix protein
MDLGPAGERVAGNVGEFRGKRGMSLRELSAALGEIGRPILPSGIVKIENGTRRVDVADLVALALALRVTPNRLFLSADHNSEPMALTPAVETTANGAWRWACGEHVIRPGVHGAPPVREVLDFMAENRPHVSGHDLPGQLAKHRDVLQPVARAARAALAAGVPAGVLMQLMVIADTIDGDLAATEDDGDGPG